MKVSIVVKKTVHRSGGGVVISHAPPKTGLKICSRYLNVIPTVDMKTYLNCAFYQRNQSASELKPLMVEMNDFVHLAAVFCWETGLTWRRLSAQVPLQNRHIPLMVFVLVSQQDSVCRYTSKTVWEQFVPTWYWQFCSASVTFNIVPHTLCYQRWETNHAECFLFLTQRVSMLLRIITSTWTFNSDSELTVWQSLAVSLLLTYTICISSNGLKITI